MHISNISKLMVVAFSLTLLSQTYTAFGATDKIALNTNRTVYSIGMKVELAGQVLGSFNPNSPAEITVTNPSGVSYQSASVSLDSSGGFTYEFTINGDSSLIGKNTMWVTHQTVLGKVSSTLSFEVRDRASITIKTDESSYMLGDNVVLRGSASPILPDSDVLIQVFNPQNIAWTFKSVPSDAISPDGQFMVKLGNLGGERSTVGTYTVKAFYAASTASAIGTFQLVSSGSQSQSNETEQTKQSGQSSTGTPSKIEVAGKNASVNTAEVAKETVVQSEIKNTQEQPQKLTYIVLIKDSDGITVSFSWSDGILAPNQSLALKQPWIPEIPGTYTAEIFFWESFNNPVVLSEKIVRTIIVK